MPKSFLPMLLGALSGLVSPQAVQAVHLDPRGLGQVLIYPYYTVNGGRATVLSVVNTTDRAKAIKLRIREGLRGYSVLDLNLYLAPFDVYTASLAADDGASTVRLLSTDASCTVPLARAGSSQGSTRYHELRYSGPADGPPGLSRTRAGWIELIEMGVVEDTPGSATVDASFYTALLPVGGRPPGCDRLVAAWTGGVWSDGPTRAASGDAVGVSSPRGGLYGTAVIVDVSEGIAFPFAADAIDGFYGLSETTLHTPPGSAAPTLASAQTSPGRATARIFAGGRAVDLNFVAGRPDAVSAVLMTDALFNEFSIEPSLGAASEWVVTFPTKHLHDQLPDAARRRPFVEASEDCEPFHLAFYDRAAGPDAPYPWVEDLPVPRQFRFCHHAQVLPWAPRVTRAPTPLLGAVLVADFGGGSIDALLLQATGDPVVAGHIYSGFNVRFLLDGEENAGAAPRWLVSGLPVTGFWAANYVNAQAQPGLLANYSTATRHRTLARVHSVLVSGEGTPGETITPVARAGGR